MKQLKVLRAGFGIRLYPDGRDNIPLGVEAGPSSRVAYMSRQEAIAMRDWLTQWLDENPPEIQVGDIVQMEGSSFRSTVTQVHLDRFAAIAEDDGQLFSAACQYYEVVERPDD